MASRFLFKATLWAELESRIPSASVVRAAVAYVGTGGKHLLPLRRGDTLVVDMSLRAVRSGVTNPKEIGHYLRKGVNVFSRGSLHAKFFIIDRALIAGSSNVSRHAKEILDEAAILTDDAAALARAKATFEQLCTEPVRKAYLQKCIDEYRPPKFATAPGGPTKRAQVRAGKVWFISGLEYQDTPPGEKAAETATLKRAERRLLDFEKSEVDLVRQARPLRYFDPIREGEWAIICVAYGRGFDLAASALPRSGAVPARKGEVSISAVLREGRGCRADAMVGSAASRAFVDRRHSFIEATYWTHRG
jgi:hypothetical protein